MISEYGSAMTLLGRSDLHRLLLSKVDVNKITMSMSIDAITQGDGKTAVTFSNGAEKTYDVVVGADGIHSKVRSLEFKDAIERFENWRIWYTWIGHEYDTPATVCEYVDTARFTIVCTAGNKTTAWFFAPADHVLWDKTEGRAARLCGLFANDPALLPAIEKLRDEDIVPTDMMRLTLSKWSKGRVVLLGDAAHSLGPLAGMGSSMAMEDAYTLAAQLLRVSEPYPLSQAFKNYERSRRVRIRDAEVMSRNIKLGALVRSRFLRKLENILMVYVPDRFLTRNLSHLMRQEI
jgi:salicylate hydroxylase